MKLKSYASGNGGLSFTYEADGLAIEPPKTIAEVMESEAWHKIAANPYWRFILGNFGTEKNPDIAAFVPVVRLDPERLQLEHGNFQNSGETTKIITARYYMHEGVRVFVCQDFGTLRERVLVNQSMLGAFNFYLDHEAQCLLAMVRENARKDQVERVTPQIAEAMNLPKVTT